MDWRKKMNRDAIARVPGQALVDGSVVNIETRNQSQRPKAGATQVTVQRWRAAAPQTGVRPA
jgi:hypothetical protein